MENLKKRNIITLLVFGILFYFAVPVMAAPNSCIECHKALGGDSEQMVNNFEKDVHAIRGLSCVDCHGGDPNDMEDTAMDASKGFKGHIERNKIPELCASCHADANYMRKYNPNIPTDQYAKYLVSQHGKLNAQGDQKVAVCISCHSVHGIRPVTDPAAPVFITNAPKTCAKCHGDAEYMKEYGIPTDQFEKYSKSVHGKALLEKGDRAAPACHSCHGSHDAARPKTTAIGNICAQCHAMSRDLFVHSPHKAAHDRLGLPECEVCHGNHAIQRTSDAMLGTGKEAVCIQCHKEGTKAFAIANNMRASIEDLKGNLSQAQALVDRAEHIGMSVDEAKFDLGQGKNSLTQARAYIHSFSDTEVKNIVDKGKGSTLKAHQGGQKAIDAFQFRRKGFWISALIIFILVLGFVLKIREMEKK
jgi:predicted CXXCH cytochrome family protein